VHPEEAKKPSTLLPVDEKSSLSTFGALKAVCRCLKIVLKALYEVCSDDFQKRQIKQELVQLMKNIFFSFS
jgi:hypothetical protein